MTASEKHQLQMRLSRLRLLKPDSQVACLKIAKEITAIENRLAGKKRRGRLPKSLKVKKEKVNYIDWEKVAQAAAKL